MPVYDDKTSRILLSAFQPDSQLMQGVSQELTAKLGLDPAVFRIPGLEVLERHQDGPHFIYTVLIDTSVSQKDHLKDVAQSLQGMYQAVQRDRQLRSCLDFCILGFDDTVRVLRDFGPLGEREKPPRLKTGGTRTALYAAMYIAYVRGQSRKRQYALLQRRQEAESRRKVQMSQPAVQLCTDYGENASLRLDCLRGMDGGTQAPGLAGFVTMMYDFLVCQHKTGVFLGHYGSWGEGKNSAQEERLAALGSDDNSPCVEAFQAENINGQMTVFLQQLQSTVQAMGEDDLMDDGSSMTTRLFSEEG